MGFQYVDPVGDNHQKEISRKKNKKYKYKKEETKGVNEV